MKNAHERFGKLVYVRRTEKTATNIRLHLDAFVGEERGKAHLASVIGGENRYSFAARLCLQNGSGRCDIWWPAHKNWRTPAPMESFYS